MFQVLQKDGENGSSINKLEASESLKCEARIPTWRLAHIEGHQVEHCKKSQLVVERPQLSKEWNQKLVVEVGQLLQLASMELKASKLQVHHALKEKQKLFD